MVWWQISDANFNTMRCCETIVGLISHSSMLKVDDAKLKGSPMFSKFCSDCDHAAMDDVRQLFMHCPKWQLERNEMLSAIVNIPGGCGRRKEGIGFYVAFNSLGHIATR